MLSEEFKGDTQVSALLAASQQGTFFANSIAFNAISYLGVALSTVILVISLVTKNYTFKKS